MLSRWNLLGLTLAGAAGAAGPVECSSPLGACKSDGEAWSPADSGRTGPEPQAGDVRAISERRARFSFYSFLFLLFFSSRAVADTSAIVGLVLEPSVSHVLLSQSNENCL